MFHYNAQETIELYYTANKNSKPKLEIIDTP